MSKIVFFGFPAHGHTNPTLEVVRELIARGSEVVYYSYDFLREKIEAAGAQFISCDEYDSAQKLAPADSARLGNDLAFSTKLLVDTTLALDEPVRRQMEKMHPDCIVADSMAVWGKAAALRLGVPYICSTTTFAFNQQSAQIMKHSFGEMMRMLFSMGRVSKEIKRLQKAGYPVKSPLDLIQSDETVDNVVYTSPEFQPSSDSFPKEKYAFVGPSIRPAQSEFHKTRDTLIYISMGTVNNDLVPLYKACMEALKGKGYQVVISAGEGTDIARLGALPEGFEVYPKVDQIAVLQKADVFFTHCGMNSATEGLYFGVPLVMLPLTDEQGGVCARVEQLHAGLRLPDSYPAHITKAVNQVLADAGFRESAQKIAEGFKACPGAKAAADKILAVCAGKQ